MVPSILCKMFHSFEIKTAENIKCYNRNRTIKRGRSLWMWLKKRRMQEEIRLINLSLGCDQTPRMHRIGEKKILKSAKLREVTKPIDKRYLSKITEFITNNSVILYQPWWEILKVWSSKLSKKIKIQLFRATTETILLYGSSTWTLTKQEEKVPDGTYTRMLRKVLMEWKSQ